MSSRDAAEGGDDAEELYRLISNTLKGPEMRPAHQAFL